MSSREHAKYREAAQRLHPGFKVSRIAHVHQMADGAFVEITAWVPKDEADKESGASNDYDLPGLKAVK